MGRRNRVDETGMMTGKSVLKRKDFLGLLVRNKNNKKRRNALVDIADTSEIKAVCEIILNLLHGNVPITKCVHKQCKRYRTVLRSLADNKTCLAVKKQILKKQSGGFWGALIPVIGAALSTLLN